MARSGFIKIFGVGPTGGAASLAVLAVFWWLDRAVGHPEILTQSRLLRVAGAVLIAGGIGLHLWSAWTLRNWWMDGRLCTVGPFTYFRHPMYAAWITFIAPGVTLYWNSWVLVCWLVVLHLIWHQLVGREEVMMADLFGDDYRVYADRTGRFIPRIISAGETLNGDTPISSISYGDFDAWLRAYGDAWENGEPEAARLLFTDDARYHENPFADPIRGIDAIRAYWQKNAVLDQDDIRFSHEILAVNGDVGLARWHAQFTRLSTGNRVILDGVFKVAFAADGKCREFREWWHRLESSEAD